MARKGSSFGRAKPKYKPQPRVLVLCEDKQSCRIYLDEAAQHFRCQASVEVAHPGRTDPAGIVAAAKAKRSEYEAVYCVFDRDGHGSFDEALAAAANAPKVDVIPSYPCYEFWLLLHFGFSRKPYAAAGGRSAAERLIHDLKSKEGMAHYDKGGPGLFAQLQDLLGEARGHAVRVLTAAADEGEPNPSTHLHTLMDLFEELGKPVPLDD